ncbi:MAG: FecR family protein [Sideroxydans sp.]|nr:FecR family protein [Sideroxydans sp.]
MKDPARQTMQDDGPAEEAAAWFLRIQDGECSQQERQEFEAWLAKSETHREEYRKYEELWSNLDRLGDVPIRKPRSKTGIAAVLFLLAAGGLFNWYAGLGEAVVTGIGEHRHVVLSDGTTVDLNTDSKIRVKMEEGRRRITLLHGEAMFNIAKDPRPLEVHASDGILRDIGTVFNVRSDGGATRVAVLEGEVQVSLARTEPVHLRGGEQLDYRQGVVSAIVPANAAEVTAWLNGRLIFRDTPLREVVDQINRYHSRPIELRDDRLAGLRVSGEFNSNDREGLIDALKVLLALDSREHLGSTELLPHP